MNTIPRRLGLLAFLPFVLGAMGSQAPRPADAEREVDAVYAHADALYRDLHRQPELSGREQRTAETLASGLRALGYEVTTGVGRTGVVGVLENGAGPVVLLRTELDGLPIEEKTGLDYASTARTKDDNGVDVGLMHACGHDVHMAAWMTTARIMAGTRTRWAGTLVLIGQPAEETLRGAQWMIEDGLLTRFPRPDFGLAIHDDARYPAGIIGYRAGPVLSNSDTIRVTIFGAGGHGARPEATIDPVVIAARTVLALQTIVSREVSPFDAAVITVGTIHAGTKANIIPAEARIELSVRSLNDKVRAHLLSAIDRIVKAEALAGRSPKEPVIDRFDGTDALVNDPALTQRVSGALVRILGSERVKEVAPEMASEDFSRFQRPGFRP
jgi:amidohydrolase